MIHLTVGKGPPARVVRSAIVVDVPGAFCLRVCRGLLSLWSELLLREIVASEHYFIA